MYVPRTAPAGVGEETAHRVGQWQDRISACGPLPRGLGSAAAVAVRWRHIRCRHGRTEYDYGKNHNRSDQAAPKRKGWDCAAQRVQRPQHNHNCPGQDGPGDGRNSDHHEQDKQFALHTKHPLS